ncbi:MAG: hypothetical protein R3A11_08715 [Bdellovibrionota bacterium]
MMFSVRIHDVDTEQKNVKAVTYDEAPPHPDLVHLIPDFIDQRSRELVFLEKLLAAKDFEGMEKISHQWSLVSKPYGFGYLATLGGVLENESVLQNTSRCEEILSEIRRYLAQKKLTLKD